MPSKEAEASDNVRHAKGMFLVSVSAEESTDAMLDGEPRKPTEQYRRDF